jgi:hypothetical protein
VGEEMYWDEEVVAVDGAGLWCHFEILVIVPMTLRGISRL